MKKGFAPVSPTQKSKKQNNRTQPISIEHLQASLSTYFDNIQDPRVDRTKQHSLKDILIITIHRCNRRSRWMGRHRKLRTQ